MSQALASSLLAGFGVQSTVGRTLESPTALLVSSVNAPFESTSGFGFLGPFGNYLSFPTTSKSS